MTLEELNALEAARADAEFRRCCGSARWAEAMTGARPFADVDAMIALGETIWTSAAASFASAATKTCSPSIARSVRRPS